MATTEEDWLKLSDGAQVYTKTWKPTTEPIALLVFLHGFSDHCNRYNIFFNGLAEQHRIQVHSFDQRGWGRSVKKPAEKGLTGPTTTVLGDITSVIESQLPSKVPVFLMGHSMGGQEVLTWAAAGPLSVRKRIAGYLAVGPYIRLAPEAEPNKLTVLVGRMAAKILPHHQLVSKLDPYAMSRDKEVCESWAADPLCHDTGTLEGLSGMLTRAEELNNGKVMIEEKDGSRVFLGHGEKDIVTSPAATTEYANRLQIKDKTLKIYERCFHCIYAEPLPDSQLFLDDVAGWIIARLESGAGSAAAAGETSSKL